MATFTEASVEVHVYIDEPSGSARMIVGATSMLANGTRVRSESWDVTSSLTAAQLTTIQNILAVATSKAKTQFNIP